MIHSRTHSPNPYIESRTDDVVVLVVPHVVLVSESNTRGYWTKHFKRHQAQRGDFDRIVRCLVRGITYPVRVDLDYHGVMGVKYMDQGNIGSAFKHIQDGIADAIGVDDGGRKFWDWHYDQHNDAPKGRTYVVVTFTKRRDGQ
jgi:hypothetical protein